MRSAFVFVCTVLVLGFGPRAGSASAAGFENGVRERLRLRLESQSSAALSAQAEAVVARRALVQFYVERGFEPAWIRGACPSERASELSRVVAAAGDDGLSPADYHQPALSALLAKAKRECRRGAFSMAEAADLELVLTDALLLYGAHLVSGKINPETLDGEWHAQRREVDLVQVAKRAVDGDVGTVLNALRPSVPEYERLRTALRQYRGYVAQGGWPELPPGGDLKDGDTGERVRVLRLRLAAEGLLAAAPGSDFDQALRTAVEAFQARHGLRVTGVVDAKTLEALNVPADRRVRQIEVNLERWRWLPQTMGDAHIRVNIPSYELAVYENDTVALRLRAIVGRHYRRTPVLSSEMLYLVINPTWGVPRTIATQDILPLLKKDPNYLKKKGMSLYDGWGADAKVINPKSVDWKRVSKGSFKYRLQQKAGSSNALGKVKFMFPNKFGVYVHDTPTRDLFGEHERAFSSGCIRIENPMRLAQYVLASDKAWDDARLKRAFRGRREQTVRFPKALPIHLLYGTAWVDEHGNAQFRADIYGRDALVDAALARSAPKTP